MMKQPIRVLFFIIAVCCATTLAAAPLFREVCSELVDSSSGSSIIEGTDGWFFLKDELHHVAAGRFWGEEAAVASRTKNKKFADPVPAIIAYNKELAAKGITLYMMPVPPKVLVYPDKVREGLAAGAAEADRALYTELYDILKKSGVKVIDLLPTLMENRDKTQLYCRTDTHFSGQGLVYFAKAAAAEIRNEQWYKEVDKKSFVYSPQAFTIRGDLLQMSGKEGEQEALQLTIVSEKDSAAQVESSPDSPVVLLGDSHALVFSVGGDLHAKGAGLFDHLTAELGFAVDLLGVRGSGVTPARIKFYQRSKKNSNYLAGKKALVWCFTARDFTGKGGWKEIPVSP